ncbi:hypothetical protein [Aphanothece microscopica]
MLPMLGLAAAPTGSMTGAAPCPAAAVAQIDGLYRWHLARQHARGPVDLTSQSARFTPELLEQLQAAYRLGPADGGFVDFDVFSGTQVSTFGARVLRCAPAADGRLEALVAVQAGLRNHPREEPVPLHYLLQAAAGGRWLIADITYPGEPGFRLSAFLSELTPVGGYGFDWRQPATARCRPITAVEAARLRQCRFERNGTAFGLKSPYHRCRGAGRSEILVYPSAPACGTALDTMESHGP